jgi:hypothetical protein
MERQHFLWTADPSTVSISLAADVITRLRDAAKAAERSDAEIGGILFGRRLSDEHICIEDFELVSSEHRRGMTFTLSAYDKRRLTQRLSALRGDLDVLGSFRTHLRQGLYMDQYDFDLMSAHFPALTDVMLLIRTTDWQAGFFVWEEGDMSRQRSYREFTFDPEALPLVDSAPEVAAPKDRTQPIPVVSPRSSNRRLPTMMKVGLVAATVGLVGVLAFYTHERHSTQPAAPFASSRTEPPRVPVVNPPVDPDINRPGDQLELHVKMAPRPSPFEKPDPRTETAPANVQAPALRRPAVPIQSTIPPEPPQPAQTASNTPPPVVAQTVLRPVHPTFVSEVSLEPTQPGIIRRGIHHVPVLNLLEKHNYKSGTGFAPARPLREVRPRLLDSTRHPNVDVKVWIDDTGQVTKAELLSDDVEPEVADVASNAAYKWAFQPARLSDRPVSSEMVMHFHFVPKQVY